MGPGRKECAARCRQVQGQTRERSKRSGGPRILTLLGVFSAVERPCYEDVLGAQVRAAKEKRKADLGALLNSGETWVVE